MRKILFNDLSRQQARIRNNLDKRLTAVLDEGRYILGKEVEELEDRLCAFTGARHCITCSSGSSALFMAIMALEMPRDANVYLPAFSFFASAEMPSLASLKLIFVDIDPVFFQMSPGALEKAILENDDKSGLILPVDLFGQSAPYREILDIAKKYNFRTLEDAAQSFGATYAGKRICNLGCDVAATSFFPAKPLGCYGDGGAIFTNDENLAEKLYSIRVHGQGKDKYDNVRLGINGRLDTLQAAILLAKLEIFADEIKKRDAVAQMYDEALEGLPDVLRPSIAPECTDVWAQYCILLPKERRADVQAALANKGVPTHVYYPVPLPYLAVFSYLNLPRGMFPVAEEISQRILALPFHPYLEPEEIKWIREALAEALR